MTLETERLVLCPLDARELALLSGDLAALERELNCRYMAEPLDGFFGEIVRKQLEKTAADPANYMWHSFWLMIRRQDRAVVGSADFKAPPDENGETEIGYGLGEGFSGHGYMTETVRAMSEWALAEGGARAVIAETERGNAASQRVLERCGFELYKEGETLWWRREAR